MIDAVLTNALSPQMSRELLEKTLQAAPTDVHQRDGEGRTVRHRDVRGGGCDVPS